MFHTDLAAPDHAADVFPVFDSEGSFAIAAERTFGLVYHNRDFGRGCRTRTCNCRRHSRVPSRHRLSGLATNFNNPRFPTPKYLSLARQALPLTVRTLVQVALNHPVTVPAYRLLSPSHASILHLFYTYITPKLRHITPILHLYSGCCLDGIGVGKGSKPPRSPSQGQPRRPSVNLRFCPKTSPNTLIFAVPVALANPPPIPHQSSAETPAMWRGCALYTVTCERTMQPPRRGAMGRLSAGRPKKTPSPPAIY